MFDIVVAGQSVHVRYVRDYLPLIHTDHFDFFSLGEPPRPLPFAPGRYRSHFAAGEQVAAFGGPAAYARRVCDEMAAGREAEFRETLEGAWPRPPVRERTARRARRPPPPATPPAGDPPTPVVPPPTPPPSPPRMESERPPRTLFDEPATGD